MSLVIFIEMISKGWTLCFWNVFVTSYNSSMFFLLLFFFLNQTGDFWHQWKNRHRRLIIHRPYFLCHSFNTQFWSMQAFVSIVLLHNLKAAYSRIGTAQHKHTPVPITNRATGAVEVYMPCTRAPWWLRDFRASCIHVPCQAFPACPKDSLTNHWCWNDSLLLHHNV